MFSYEVALNYWEVLLLILVRVASFVSTAPFFSLQNVPAKVKLGLAVFMSMIVFWLIPTRSIEYNGIIEYAIIVLKESIVGLLLGFVCNVCTQTITFAGHIIDVNIGLSMATMYDPTTREQTSVSGTLYYYSVYILLLITGMYHLMIAAIIDSYSIIAIDSVKINDRLYDSFLGVIADYFIIGLRIALPVFVALMILNVILGVLTKVASQLNMFAIGIQLKLLAGLGVMFLSVFLMPSIAVFLNEKMGEFLKNIAGGLV